VHTRAFKNTPIQRLGIKLNNNTLYIKRDDLIPISFGGNKARKAVLFFEDLEMKGGDCIVTYGSSSSNHCRIISNIAASKGIPCYIISPIEACKPTYNSKMVKLFGAQVTRCAVEEVQSTINSKIEELKALGYKPYFIQGGGHGNIGTRAYINAYKEILDYESDKDLYFDYIFHASGTGTTQAGLVCGGLIYENRKKIVGISIARKNPYGGQVVLDSINDYLEGIGRKGITSNHINFIDDYILDGYGSYSEDILDTIKEALVFDGIPMDTTYTGKAFWGMKEYIKKNRITDKNILFIHTGGTPLFFDSLGELVNEGRY
jgi:D-cysteine desulfhydrase